MWIVDDDEQALVVDAAHEPDRIAEVVDDRRLVGIVCTHTTAAMSMPPWSCPN